MRLILKIIVIAEVDPYQLQLSVSAISESDISRRTKWPEYRQAIPARVRTILPLFSRLTYIIPGTSSRQITDLFS